jgi:hypothetical protein
MKTAGAALGLAIALAAWSCGGHSASASAASPSPPASPPVNGPEGWAMLSNSPASPANARHDDIVFIDAANGWLINSRGEVYRTEDGGTTRQSLSHFPNAIFPRCVGFASSSRGWVGNINTTAGQMQPDSSLWETTDGGRYSTEDGGLTWKALAFGTRINRMRVLNESLVYASGDRVYCRLARIRMRPVAPCRSSIALPRTAPWAES